MAFPYRPTMYAVLVAAATAVVACGGGESRETQAGVGASAASGSGGAEAASSATATSSSSAGGTGGAAGSGGAAPLANVFVSTTGDDMTCVRGDAGKPCLTFDHAYHVALDGDLVEVEQGSYAYQRMTYDASKAGPAHVTFAPAQKANVTVASLDFGQDQLNIVAPQHVTVQGMTFSSLNASVEVWKTAVDIELDDLTGHALQLLGGSHLRVNGGDWGKCTVTADGATNCTSRMIGTDVVIDRASFHDVVHDGTEDPSDLSHTEGLFIRGCNGCTLTHSKFWHDTTFDVFVQNCCSLPPNQDVQILNNWFASPGVGSTGDSWTGGAALSITTPTPGMVIAHNSFAENAGVNDVLTGGQSWVGTNAVVAANYLQRGNMACQPGMTFRANVFIPFSQFTGQQPCDPSEKKVATFAYVNAGQDGSFDYHGTAASPGVGLASPADSTLAHTDIDGQPWPSVTPDVGSDQQ